MTSILTLLALLLWAPSVSAASRRNAITSPHASRVETTLARHIEGEAIGNWLATLPAAGLEREAAEWILAWLPASDLIELTPTLLREHVHLAVLGLEEAPWRDQLPHDLWLHFVVPHRVSQEPAQSWRGRIRAELWPRVREAESMELAALEVNRWCREQATFQSTSGRDAGPLTTMARGIGRCEEEMILTICALRAVGIPARSCATPYWTFTDNNHAWVEVWADGRWFYLGGCEPDRCLGRAWFSGAARRAGFVRSVGYGEFYPSDEPLYRVDKGSTIINTTAVYTDPISLTARLGGRYADCVEQEIYINVLNFGSLRPLAKITSGDTIELGPGEYAITGGPVGELLLEVAGGRSGSVIDVILDESDLYDLDASPGFWLRYPEGDQSPARDLDLVTEETHRLTELRIRALADDRVRLRTPNERERAQLAALAPEERSRIEEILVKPLERASLVFLLLEHYADAAGRAALLTFLEQADDKDLLELNELAIRDHIDCALAVRTRLEPLGLTVPDSLFATDILACRIEREPGGAWRSDLPLLELGDTVDSTLRSILTAHHARLELIDDTFFGSPLNPAQSWRLGRGTERDLGVGLVGLLRRNGLPARYRHGRVETWTGAWTRLDPETGDLYQSADSASGDTPGLLSITITRGGLPWSAAESYSHFNICRPKAGHFTSPWWDPVLGEQEWDSGGYILCSAMRVPGGSIYGRLRSFKIEPGELTEVTLPLDIDASDWDPSALVAEPGVETLQRALSSIVCDDGLPVAGEGLLFCFAPGEPAARMITALGRVAERLAAAEIAFRPLLLGGDEAQWRDKLAAAGLPADLQRDSAARLADLLPTADLFQPLVYLKVGGESLLLRQGFDTGIDNSVHLALDVLQAR
ncbi:MAG: transglutaminase domain-containing protein [bacterium]|nr:transglutaminase domain-containing protein [bacterium]